MAKSQFAPATYSASPSVGDPQKRVIAFLSNSATYGQSEPVEICETHGSIVFLSKTHAHKLKRAVKFPYMDYSTQALRKAMCQREFEINRRMAPEMYETVHSIVDDDNVLQFGSKDDPRAIDWVVVMKRFDQRDLLEERRKNGTLAIADAIRLGEVLAEFHAKAELTPSFGGSAGIQAVVEENISILRATPEAFPAGLVDRYAALSQHWLNRLRTTLDNRRSQGLVRRCHGDLHLNNICMIGGSPQPFDAVEFQDAFSCIDVAYDLAFLLMDLDFKNLRGHANALLNRYLECSGDYSLLAPLPLLLSCRAGIRAHVTLAMQKTRSSGSGSDSRALLEKAAIYLEPQTPVMIAIGGFSGAGKSSVARELAPTIGAAPGAVVLRTDVIRKEMLNVPKTSKLGECAYSRKTSRAVYARLRLLAEAALKAGHSVIADATFGDDEERRAIELVAAVNSVAFSGFWLTAPRAILEDRLRKRQGDASDADVRVLANQIATFSQPENWTMIEASGQSRDIVRQAKQHL